MSAFRFISPAVPTWRALPPTGNDWQHELKHDGWRVQVHVNDGTVWLLSRNANDLGHRFSDLVAALRRAKLPDVVIDGELIGCDENGWPNFYALQRRAADHCVWAFDLLWLEGKDLCTVPLVERRRRLASVVKRAALPCLRFSEA